MELHSTVLLLQIFVRINKKKNNGACAFIISDLFMLSFIFIYMDLDAKKKLSGESDQAMLK